jgi:hypothetical protein
MFDIKTPLVASTAATVLPESQEAVDKAIATVVIVVATVIGDVIAGWIRRKLGGGKKTKQTDNK